MTHHYPWKDLNQNCKDGSDKAEQKSGLECMVNHEVLAVMVVGAGESMSGE